MLGLGLVFFDVKLKFFINCEGKMLQSYVKSLINKIKINLRDIIYQVCMLLFNIACWYSFLDFIAENYLDITRCGKSFSLWGVDGKGCS